MMAEAATMLRAVFISTSQEELLDAIPGWDDVQQAGKAIDDTPSQPSKPADDSPSQLLWPRDSEPVDERPTRLPWATEDGGSDDLFGSQSASQLQVERGVFDVTGSTLSEPSQEPVEWLSPEDAEEMIEGLLSPPLPIATASGLAGRDEYVTQGEASEQGGDFTCFAEGFESDRSQSPRRSRSRRRFSWNLASAPGCIPLEEEGEGIREATTALLAGLARRSASEGRAGSQAEAKGKAVAEPEDGAEAGSNAPQTTRFFGYRNGDLDSLRERPTLTDRGVDAKNEKQQQEADLVHHTEKFAWRSFPLVLVPPLEVDQKEEERADVEVGEDPYPPEGPLLPGVNGVDQAQALLHHDPTLPSEKIPEDAGQRLVDDEAQDKGSRECTLKRKRVELGQEETGEARASDGPLQCFPHFLDRRQPPPAVQEKLDRLRSQKNRRRADQQNFAERETSPQEDDSLKQPRPPLVPETVLDAIRMRTFLRTKKSMNV